MQGKMKKLAMAITMATFSLNAHSAQSEADNAGHRVLKVGCEAAFAPFTYIDDKGKLIGFDLDLIRAMGKAMGYDEVVVNALPFDGLIPAIMTDNIDLIISGFTISEERAKKVDFSDPYYMCGLTMLVNKKDADRVNKIEDLEGHDVCLQIGTTGALYAQKQLQKAKLKQFNSPPDTYLELQNGGCIAALNDSPVNDFFLNNYKGNDIVSKKITTGDSEYYGIAVNKGNKELLDRLNKALSDVQKSGEFKEISMRWFGRDISDDFKQQ